MGTLAKVLTPDQLKRLMEIDLQQRDYEAFGDVSVQARLKLNKDQKDSIKTILGDSEKELKARNDRSAVQSAAYTRIEG